MQLRALCAVALCLLMAACATDAAKPGAVAAASTAAMPPPDNVRQDAGPDYRAVAGDSVDVNVFNEPLLTRNDLLVADDGSINLPPLGTVIVAGKTGGSVASELAQKLTPGYVRNPVVTVTIKPSANQFTVDGGVVQPGIYNVSGKVTLLQAIATAKGVSGDADESKVAIFRITGGQKNAYVFNLKDVRTGRSADPLIYADDLIEVPTNGTMSAFRDAAGSASLLSLLFR